MSKLNIKEKEFNNSIELSLDVIGGKWKMPILWLLKDDSKRYGELKKSTAEL